VLRLLGKEYHRRPRDLKSGRPIGARRPRQARRKPAAPGLSNGLPAEPLSRRHFFASQPRAPGSTARRRASPRPALPRRPRWIAERLQCHSLAFKCPWRGTVSRCLRRQSTAIMWWWQGGEWQPIRARPSVNIISGSCTQRTAALSATAAARRAPAGDPLLLPTRLQWWGRRIFPKTSRDSRGTHNGHVVYRTLQVCG
jgi:hypothetical protein